MVIVTTVYGESRGCPAPELIKPCVCEDNGIICVENSDIDLVNIFQTLEKNLTKSEKHFKRFYLNNNFITELKENTFKRITFNEISILWCKNLTKIHINAFAQTDLITKIFKFNSNTEFKDNSIFEVISKFINLEELELGFNGITEIPSNALQRVVGYQDELKRLYFGGLDIKKIGSRAFSFLRSLESIIFQQTSIDYIPENAFEFDEESNQRMSIRFNSNNLLNSSSFHQDSLTHFKRPVTIDLKYSVNHFKYLDEKVFKNFLNSNPENMIDMSGQIFDCNDCTNFWLTKQQNLLERFNNLSCSNNKIFNDTDNFAECGPYQSLKPCTFDKNKQSIDCGGNTDIQLKAIFHNFSKQLSDNEKHFKMFYLSNTYIKVLEENTLSDITFDEIWIMYCDNLTNIDRYAFTSTDLMTKEVEIRQNYELSMDNSIFDILSSFVNIEFIFLQDIGVNEIPSNAFRPINGYQKNLRGLNFWNSIHKIGSHAFSNLKNLKVLSLDIFNLNSISDYAFEFEEYSDQIFIIEFIDISDFSAFNEKTLLNIRRATELRLLDNDREIFILEEKVFLPFLLDNEKNTIHLEESQVFDCNDCRNYWIKNNQNVTNRVSGKCSNKKQLNDPDNFKNCTMIV